MIMKPIKQTVYLPKINGNTCGLCHRHDYIKKEAFVFTPEQLNEYTRNVIKQSLETAAEKVKVKEARSFTGVRIGSFFASKESITNTFEETFKQFEV